MIKIDARNVDFYYGDFHALKNISMQIEANTSVAFIGPSGCGKSTFLRLFNRMNDLIPDTRMTGTILIDNRNDVIKKLKYGQSIIRICRDYGVSRDTFNKFRNRYASVQELIAKRQQLAS